VTALILICAATLAPADCQRETAIDMFYGPPVEIEVQCGLYSQALAAEVLPPETMERIVNGQEFVVVRCTRSNAGGNVG
jgi:hypothetical protein